MSGEIGLWVVVIVILTCVLSEGNLLDAVGGIGCFRCVSVAGSNPPCEDTFHNNHSGQSLFELPCLTGRKGRDGTFPASACIKLTGIYDDTGEVMTVRGCSLDSGTLTIDTELTRTSSCGAFYFGERYVRGCVQSCSDTDGCNSASKLQLLANLPVLGLTITHWLTSCLLAGTKVDWIN